MSEQATISNKPFDLLLSLLNADRIKEKQPYMTSNQSYSLALSTITQMLTHSNFDQAQLLLEEIGEIIYSSIKMIMDQSNPLKRFKNFLANNVKSKGRNLLKSTHQTMKAAMDTIRPQIGDNLLQAQNIQIRNNLKKKALQNDNISIAIDPTVKKYTGKKSNQCQPKGYIGQKEIYGKAFSECTIYDSTGQFVLATHPKYASGTHYKHKELPDWIQKVKSEIQTLNTQNIEVKAIYGDREYYQGIGFAFSTLGLWNSQLSPQNNPRFCVPKKMTNGFEKKWEFLLDPSRNVIENDEIELNYYHQGLIGSSLHYFASNTKGTRFMIPFYSVATFDAYSNGKRKHTLEWARIQAQKIELSISNASQQLQIAEETYLQYRQKNFLDKKAEIPKYKGKLRNKFKDNSEKPIYLLCRKYYDLLKRSESKKINLCKRLMFFCVSSRLYETIEEIKIELIKVARGYHQRWGIESAFQSIKGRFWIPCKKRSVQARHIRFIMSSLIYNSWHYYRLLSFKRKSQIKPQTIRAAKIWHKNVNKKILTKLNHTMTAGAFIAQSWSSGVIECLKSKIK